MSFLDNDGLSYLWNKIKTIFMTRSQVDSLLASNYYVKTQASVSSSSDININNAAQYKALDAIISIKPVQDLHGYSNPWPAGGGKNLFDKAAITDNTWIDDQGVEHSVSGYWLSDYIPVTAGETYFRPQTGSGRNAYYASDKSFISYVASQNTALVTPSNAAYFRFVGTGTTYNDNIQFEKGSYATSYVPYSNVCPITGWTGAQVTRKGKNLLDLSGITPVKNENGLTITVNENGSIDITGTANSQAQIYWRIPSATASGFAGMLLDCLPAAKSGLFVILEESGGSYTNFATNNSASGTVISDNIATLTNYANFIIRISSGTAFPEKYTVWPMIRPVSSESGWVPYNGEIYSITFPSAVGTVCSGTLDVTNGKLTVESVLWTKNTSTMDNGEAYPGWRNAGVAAILGTGLNKTITTVANIGTKIGINTSTGVSGDVLFLNPNDYGKTNTEWKALAMDVQVVLPLATPITYNLIPQDITLLRGTNYILANCGDISLRYFLLGIEDIISEVSTSSIPSGGTFGQALIKNTGADYDLAWGDMLPKDISTLTSLPQAPSSGDLLAVRSGNDTYKIDYNALASAILTNIGDGSFESLNVNTSAGSGSVNIQRYGKMRFLFVQYRPTNAGTDQHIAQVNSSDAPSEDLCFACTGYAYPGQSEFVLMDDGKLILHAYGTPNNTLKGTIAYMVP